MQSEAKRIASQLRKRERDCILNWGDDPIPDSIWFGRYAGLKNHAPDSANTYALSPLGLEVQALLRATTTTITSRGKEGD